MTSTNAPTPAFDPDAPRQTADGHHVDPQHWQDILLKMFDDSSGMPELWSRYPRVRDASEREPLRESLRILVLKRDGFRCRFCGQGGRLEVDHIIPWSAGGSDKSTNLRTLCCACNQERSNFRFLDDDSPSRPIGSSCDWCYPSDEPVGAAIRQVHMWCATCNRPSATSRPESLS